MQELSDDRLLQALHDSAEQTRSAAAVELARRHHPQALEACLRTINDAAEPAHPEFTPSVGCLVAMGVSAVEPLLDRMAGGDDTSRLRAVTAFMHISKRRFGFDGNRWSEGGYAVWSQWWSGLAYDHRAEADARGIAVTRLSGAVKSWR